MKIVSAALPKTYHQLADLRGTGCAAVSRITPPICSRCSNQSPICSSLDIHFSSCRRLAVVDKVGSCPASISKLPFSTL